MLALLFDLDFKHPWTFLLMCECIPDQRIDLHFDSLIGDSDGVGIYCFAEQGDHAHELVTELYRTSIWSLAALFSERVGMNART